MKKYLNISLLCYSLPSNHVWAYGETVDTPVLGTGLARGESSNLSTPTRFAIILGLIASVVSKFLIKFVAVNVALRTKCCSTERVCIEKRRLLGHWLDLGFTHQTHTYPLLHIFQQYQQSFFKLNTYPLVDRLCNKCNKCIKVRHLPMQHSHQ